MPSATPRTPDRPRGAARRVALLEATLALLGEVGADAVTHRRVAERAGLPLASTTYWFASKDQLLTEALRHAAERDLTRLRAAVATLDADADVAGDPLSPEAVVATLLDPCLGTGPTADAEPDPGASRGSLLAVYTLMLEAARRPALQELSRDWTAAYLETVATLLRRAGSRRPAADARLLIAAADGLLIDALAGGTEQQTDAGPQLARLARVLVEAPR